MHFALPPRKSSRPPPYSSSSSRPNRSTYFRRARLRTIAWILGIVGFFFFLFTHFRTAKPLEPVEIIPAGTPSTVLVTLFDHQLSSKYENMVRENRELYARKQGYAAYFPNIADYDLTDPPCPSSWAKIPAIRHAMTHYPHSTYFFLLDQHALIMRPELSIEEHIIGPNRIKDIMIPEQPVVPPDSVIRTYKNLAPENVDLVITQDDEGLAQTSLIVRRGEWAKFFLDSWFDPLYRSYNFQRAEGHALEHLVQWHGTVLARMAIVPQRIMNAYTKTSNPNQKYADGDFVAHFHGCDIIGSGRSCEKEVTPMYQRVASAHSEPKL